MKKVRLLVAAMVIILVLSGTSALSQEAPRPPHSKPLVLTGAIPLPNILGRIDHLAFDGKGRLFVSALGNDSEEVIDLPAGTRVHSIGGIPRPQGVVYAPEFNKLFVGSDEGKLYIYDGSSFDLLTSIDFREDVDNLRYDAASKHVYVGYGDEDAGAISMVDAATNKRLDGEFKLGAHPESFQLAKSGPHIYVNLPDLKQIADINRDTRAIVRWPVSFAGNFPMALDEAAHRLFVTTRAPARLAVFDTASGHMVASLPCVLNSDDLFFDAARKRIYAAGGEGYLSVFQQLDANHYQPLANVPSAIGARTAGYPGKGIKGFDQFYLAVPARADHGAEVLIYTVQD
jgi:DNA-binding beta-propeller fold protein YncE